jgi:branched-chain amino acid transport system ATP-binding protein
MLEIRDLHVHYGGIHALKGVSLTVHEGETVALIGANGAGKSTTLRTISGLVRPSAGIVSFRGQDLTKMAAYEIVRLGLLQAPEGRRIFGNMTVLENLQLGAYARKDQSGLGKEMDEVLQLFPRLKERIHQNAGTLSGGEQQMLAIGRALMGKPMLLLLDEPSLGLAPFLVAEIFRIIKRLNEEGRTILLVEQNAKAALNLAHRGYVLETGSVVLTDDARALLRNDQVRAAYLGES